MALSYHRLAHTEMASRRSIRVSVPTAVAREATPTVRRVRFSPAAVPSGTPPQGEEEEEEDEIAEAAHLPQTFLHALVRCFGYIWWETMVEILELLLINGDFHTCELARVRCVAV